MVPRRNCCVVIRQMLEKVPSDKEDFIEALRWNLNDASYKAPEETLQWERTAETLQRYIPYPPTEDWQFEVLSIFMVKPVNELRAELK